jgi:hypothetical protein
LQAQSAGAALSSNGFKLFSSVVKCAGADKAAADAKLKVTVLAPTDSVSPITCRQGALQCTVPLLCM